MYCCALTEKSRKSLHLSDFCSITEGSWNDSLYYAWGFLVAAKSAGYIDFTSGKNGNKPILQEIKCNQLLTVDIIKKELEQKSNSDKDRLEIKKIEDFCNEE